MNVVPVRVVKGRYLLVAFRTDGRVEVQGLVTWSEGGKDCKSYPLCYRTYEAALAAVAEFPYCRDWNSAYSREEYYSRLAAYRVAVK